MTKTKAFMRHIEHLQRIFFWSFTGMTILLGAFYIYFVLPSVSMVFTRTDLERQISTAQSKLSDLELRYVSRKDALILPVAEELGFQPTAKKNFITKKALTEGSLTFNVQ